VELLVRNGTVITGDAGRRVLARADVLVRDGRIAKIGKGVRARGGARLIDADGMLVLPGLVHGHIHACQTLMRNRADGLELLDWLSKRIWPMEAAHDAATMRASADLTFLELIKSGATAALDMGTVHHYERVFESARDAGVRLVGGKAMMDEGAGVPKGLQESTRASLDDSLALLERWHGEANGRLRYAFCPRFALSCTDELMREVARLSREKGVRVHTHASENRKEIDAVRARFGQDNIRALSELGLGGPHVTLAHAVWLSAEERELLARERTCVCHCPSSNLKLASGIAEVPELIEAGVTVALGADGAPCNNNLDLFLEMRLAALLQKPRKGPLSMPPGQVLEMATRHGARALGLEDEIGSLEPDKRADLIVVDPSGAHATPVGEDPIAQLVYSCRATDVRDVVIDGRVVMLKRRVLTLDERAVRARAEQAGKKLARAVR
jgi:5-methylthioadenosine/S-adenosylhomocysteine deaminase